MASLPKVGVLSVEDYLAIEQESETKYEFFDGEIIAMSGASREHNQIVGNLIRAIGIRLLGQPCDVYPSDMRVRTPSHHAFLYPDVSVVCGNAQFDPKPEDTLLNPTVLFEVLSEATESYDRGLKAHTYRSIPALQELVLVSQDEARIEQYTRDAEGRWYLQDIVGLNATLTLASLGCALPLSEIYHRIALSVDEG